MPPKKGGAHEPDPVQIEVLAGTGNGGKTPSPRNGRASPGARKRTVRKIVSPRTYNEDVIMNPMNLSALVK